MSKLYILLGGNLGDKQKIFSETLGMLARRVGKITLQSSVYETEPWGFHSEDLFWNQVIEMKSELLPEEILSGTKQIELEMGRTRKTDQFDSRRMDIDILFYGDQIINQGNLIVPHPRIQERKFVLVPLCEIAPDFIHPVIQKSVRKLLDECSDQLMVKKVNISS